MMSHWPVAQALVMLENSTRAEAAACVKKYFVAASTARGWWDLEIRGMMASVFQACCCMPDVLDNVNPN